MSYELYVYPEVRHGAADNATSAAASPGSCSFNDQDSLSGSLSSDCLSLACTETDLGDVCIEDVDSFGDLSQELQRSDEDFTKLCSPSSDLSELHSLIRDDLQKQDEMRSKPAQPGSAPAPACTAARRLPPTHRKLIVGWMRDVSRALRLQMSTLFMSASLLDRYVASAQSLPPDGMLQLLALACISSAVKFNEVTQVLPAVWLGLAVDATTGRRLYAAQDLQRMEFSLLQTLGWRLHVPTTHTFLQHFLLCLPHPRGVAVPAPGFAASGGCEMLGLPQVLASLTLGSCGLLRAWPVASGAFALAEMALTSEAFLPYAPSTVALACLAMSELLAGPPAAGPQPGLPVPCAWSPSATALVAAAAGRPLHLVAPGLDDCAQELDRCCRLQGACTAAVRV